jgi:hypothetical protein
VPELNVRPVDVVKVTGVVLDKVTADPFNDMVLVLEFDDDNPTAVKL